MKPFSPADIEVVSLSDMGRQRSSNQDSYGEGPGPAGARLIMVADGMGGHAGGETASRVAVETVRSVVAGSEAPAGETLRHALEEANRVVHDEAQRNAQLAGMGTTGVAMLFAKDGAAYIGNVGDSRAYRLRAGNFEQITFDHSLVAELQRRGILSEEEALVHPRRNEVLRSLGVEPEVEVDLHELDLAPGDLFLLCSDGLSGVVRDPEIAELLQGEPPAEAARRLVALANERGGPDNITVQVARIPVQGEGSRGSGGELGSGNRALTVALVLVASLLCVALVWALLRELGAGGGATPSLASEQATGGVPTDPEAPGSPAPTLAPGE